MKIYENNILEILKMKYFKYIFHLYNINIDVYEKKVPLVLPFSL